MGKVRTIIGIDRELMLFVKGYFNPSSDIERLKRFLEKYTDMPKGTYPDSTLYAIGVRVLVVYGSKQQVLETMLNLFKFKSETDLKHALIEVLGQIAIIEVLDAKGNRLISFG